MDYTTSTPFTGSPATAVESARAQLMATGFQIDHASDTELVATGPGMHSTNQNAILGMTHAKIIVSSGTIDIYAELGGVKFMQRFIYIFPPALGAILALTFAFVPNGPSNPLFAFAPIMPWIVISPLMAKWIKKRTTKAIDTLLHNMASSRK
jgi:hypothetical protein